MAGSYGAVPLYSTSANIRQTWGTRQPA